MSSRSKKKRELQYGSRWAGQEIEERRAHRESQINLVQMRQTDREMKLAELIGSADGLTMIPEWKKAELARKQAVRARLMKNGITPEDLQESYDRGRRDATKEYVDKLLPYQQKFFYSAAAIASHELFGFGEARILRLLDRVQQIMCEEISTGDVIRRAKDETGVDMFEEEYTI